MPVERCRLVKYEEFHDSLECSFEGQEEEVISEVLGGVRTSYKFDLLMEIRDEDKQFEVYKPGGECQVGVSYISLGCYNVSFRVFRKVYKALLPSKSI